MFLREQIVSQPKINTYLLLSIYYHYVHDFINIFLIKLISPSDNTLKIICTIIFISFLPKYLTTLIISLFGDYELGTDL